MKQVDRRAYALLSLAALAAAAVYLLARATLRAVIAEDRARARAVVATRALETLVATIRDAESGQRGYLLTEDTAYLEPYQQALRRWPVTLAAVADADWPPGEAAAVRAAAEAKLARLVQTVQLARAGRCPESLALVREGTGRRLMEELVTRSGRMVAASEAQSTALAARLDRSAAGALTALPLGLAMTLGLVCLALVVAVRHERAAAVLKAERDDAARQADENARVLNAVCHDIKHQLNPVALLVSSASATVAALAVTDPLARTAMDDLAAVRRNVGSLTETLERLLDLARADRGPIIASTFPASSLVADVADVCRPVAAAKNLAVVIDAPPGLILRSDRVKLKRILINLTHNAVKFTSSGTVTVRSRPGRGGVRFEVADTGMGIARDEIPQLFRDFAQVDNPERDPAKGFGLGLAIVDRLARQLGASITIESRVGCGSTFTVEVPDLPKSRPGLSSAPDGAGLEKF